MTDDAGEGIAGRERVRERVLVVEDDASLRRLLAEVFDAYGYAVSTSPDGAHALETLQQESVDLVVTDLDMPGMRGDALLAQIGVTFPEIPVIAVTAFGSVEHAAALTRSGAADYLAKPFKTAVLLGAVRRVIEQTRARRTRARERRKLGAHLEGLVGMSRPMLRLFDRIGRVAASPAPVLVTGETGTGKELVARAVHRASGRGAFVPVNCGAIPEALLESELFGHARGAFPGAEREKRGLFEAADGGTLFLDEIGELPLVLQPKLLRVLESGEVRRVGDVAARRADVRIVVATSRDLEAAVETGDFRSDLLWRVNVLHLEVPALRDRSTDIPLLVEHHLQRAGRRADGGEPCIASAALAALVEYPWPGNVRQLLGVLERALTFADGREIGLADLPAAIRRDAQRAELTRSAAERELTLAQLEREYIFEVLRRVGGNKSRAADWLDVPRRTLYRRLEEYGVTPEP